MSHSPGKAKVWFSLQSANLHTHLPHSISKAEHFAFTRSWGSASGKNAGRLADKTSPLPRLDERRATIKWAVVAWNILQDLLLEEGCRNGFLGETWPLSVSNVFLSSQQPHSSPFLFFLIHWAATFIVPWKLGKYVCYGGAQTTGWYIALDLPSCFYKRGKLISIQVKLQTEHYSDIQRTVSLSPPSSWIQSIRSHCVKVADRPSSFEGKKDKWRLPAAWVESWEGRDGSDGQKDRCASMLFTNIPYRYPAL